MWRNANLLNRAMTLKRNGTTILYHSLLSVPAKVEGMSIRYSSGGVDTLRSYQVIDVPQTPAKNEKDPSRAHARKESHAAYRC